VSPSHILITGEQLWSANGEFSAEVTARGVRVWRHSLNATSDDAQINVTATAVWSSLQDSDASVANGGSERRKEPLGDVSLVFRGAGYGAAAGEAANLVLVDSQGTVHWSAVTKSLASNSKHKSTGADVPTAPVSRSLPLHLTISDDGSLILFDNAGVHIFASSPASDVAV
jgi:hypothetical protein